MKLLSNKRLLPIAVAFAAGSFLVFGAIADAAAQRASDESAAAAEAAGAADAAEPTDPTKPNDATKPTDASQAPEAAIEQLWSALEGATGEDEVEARYRRLDPVVAATHDLPYIAELTIRRSWPSLEPEQRERFIAAFERLSVMTYASRFAALKPGMFEVTGSRRSGNGRAQVEAVLTTPKGEKIPFEYLLHETQQGWKIVNILADNVSDLALKRAEYREVLDKGSIDDLIRHVEQQADDAARGGEVKARQ